MGRDGVILGLGLESSCDETAAAVAADGRTILSSAVSSQIDLHREYCGVVPEIASRAHLEAVNYLIDAALKQAEAGFGDLDYVSVTNRPGLVGSLLITVQSAKAISYALGIPLIGVSHLEAHLYAPFLEGAEREFPFIGLLVSGGNTALYEVRGTGDMKVIGRTTDDAVGEAFDKAAKFLDLGYPGGPAIERLAERAEKREALFPKILPGPGDFRFSYSGIKTALINYVRKNPGTPLPDIAWSFQERALELLVRRTLAASRERGIKRIVVAGGVAANGRLREMFGQSRREDETVLLPSAGLCTDNAAMVAGLGYRYYVSGKSDGLGLDVMAKEFA
ncbi:MAG: tRNA (adenosine(37)-N6)-threonylcarbamoyltransferase complex transferase subunit TsaD [Spirochaetes bacterium]|jgi:N6-L-threonylcarbamoyladenine synthase|nr:tRNA (adenosine(37)-N6)-threonylcarbamoyltransferase complex transferase subunit TsaD [Spirochaetota bacterium]